MATRTVEVDIDLDDIDADELINALRYRKLSKDEIEELHEIIDEEMKVETIEAGDIEISITSVGKQVTGVDIAKINALLLFVKRNFDSLNFEQMLK